MSLLEGGVAVVTGASRGIGLAVAVRLEELGARVVRAARSLRPAQSGRRLDVSCDITDPGQVAALVQRTREVFGVPTVAVASAGAFMLAPLEDTPPEDFTAQLSANLAGPFLLARALLPAMKAAGRGRLITLGSVADHRAFPENAGYAASKFGLRGLHEVLREEYRGSGVLCTLVSPGPTDTQAWDAVDPDRREGFVPRARMLRPEDVAEAVAWVCCRPAHVDVDWLRLGPA
ncbi:MAG TPA: SDR family oxidoreductase [Gemmatimonadales bacterium]|nr:SDR family oxidoreductase [Gemmatimonadales bacterium]